MLAAPRARGRTPQDVLVIAYRKIQEGAFHPPEGKPLSGAVAAWLTGISRGVAKDFRDSLAMQASMFVDEEHDRADPDAPAGPSMEAQWMAKTELAILTKVKLSAVGRSPRTAGETLLFDDAFQ